jgi:hypothetical protein
MVSRDDSAKSPFSSSNDERPTGIEEFIARTSNTYDDIVAGMVLRCSSRTNRLARFNQARHFLPLSGNHLAARTVVKREGNSEEAHELIVC